MAISKAEGAIEGAICRRFLCLREKSTKLWVWGRLKHIIHTQHSLWLYSRATVPFMHSWNERLALECPSQSHDDTQKSHRILKRKRAKRAFQKVYWHGSFDFAPSLYGRGGYYVGVPMREDQDATVSTSLCRMCQTSAELSPKIHEKKHPKRYIDMTTSTVHLLYMIGQSAM